MEILSNERKKLSVFDSKYIYFSKLGCFLMDHRVSSSTDITFDPSDEALRSSSSIFKQLRFEN